MLSSLSIGRQGRHAGVAAHVFSPCALAGRGNWRWRASVSAASSRSRRQAPFINSTRPNPTSPRFRIHQLLHAASRSLTPSLPVPVTPPLSPPAGAMGSTGREPEVTRADFPDGFVFGVATSAYQIEGARREGGKGDSIWDVFTDDKERVLDRSNAEIAVDHYHRYKEDIELMASLGFSAYRFSISWARIFPDGLGEKVNEQGVAFYNDLINFMISKGIEPYATLYHWDLPNNLQKTLGGWISDKIVEYFALYAEACFANFGDRVKHWITINEPLQTAINGYGIGIFAPGGTSQA